MLLAGVFFALLGLAAAVPRSVSDGGDVKSYEFTLTWETYAPVGKDREMVLVNGEFPGPLMELTEGDEVSVTVHNKLPFNTTMHFHGIEMRGTPWSDGTPGLTQYPIRPNETFVYQWKATQYGSYWYHAHQRGQIDDGFYGPIVIHPADGTPTPFQHISNDTDEIAAMEEALANVRPLLLSDLRHATSEEAWQISRDAGIELPCYDAILFNGKGSIQCWTEAERLRLMTPEQKMVLQAVNETVLTPKGCLSARVLGTVLAPPGTANAVDLSKIPEDIFDRCTPTDGSQEVITVDRQKSGGWVAIDLVATFGLVTGSFSIDGHSLHVYGVDGAFIEPQTVQALTVTNGDRHSVLIKLDRVGRFPIRVASTAAAQSIAAHAILHVVDGDDDGDDDDDDSSTTPGEVYIDEVGVNRTESVVFFDATNTRMFPVESIAETADQTFKMSMQVAGSAYNWALNHTHYPMELDNDHPLLFAPDPSRFNNVTLTTKNDTWVDIIFITATFPMPPHPIHKHGNKMYMIGSGSGNFSWASVAEAMLEIPDSFNLVDPPKRDTVVTPPAITGPSWLAIRYHVDNPGAWFLHCHIESHMMGGMSAVIQDGVDAYPDVPEEYRQPASLNTERASEPNAAATRNGLGAVALATVMALVMGVI